MTNANTPTAATFWLNRHVRGWGLVSIVLRHDNTPEVVYVLDHQTWETYPALRRELRLFHPKTYEQARAC